MPATTIPTTAHTPPAPTTVRGPTRTVSAPAVTDVATYATYEAAASSPIDRWPRWKVALMSGASRPKP